MAAPKVVVIDASAGGIEALSCLFGAISPDIPTAILVIVHMGRRTSSNLPEILGRTARLPVETARDGAPLRLGHAYVAPPDQHLLLRETSVRLWHGPRENRHRPAVDPLFRSAARFFGPRAIGVVLSGNLDDGAAGLRAIGRAGGTTVVQSPGDALFPGMPNAALAMAAVDHIVPASAMGPLLEQLARAEVTSDRSNLAPPNPRGRRARGKPRGQGRRSEAP